MAAKSSEISPLSKISRLRRVYTDEEKQTALAIYELEGIGPACKAINAPPSTVLPWCVQAGLRPMDGTRMAEACQVWENTKARLVLAMSSTAETFTLWAEELRLEGKAADAKAALVTAAIATDKAQLLTGAATSRAENLNINVEGSASEIDSLLSRLESRQTVIDATSQPAKMPKLPEPRDS